MAEGKTVNNAAASTAEANDTLSVPLYVAGLIVTLCGIQVVNTAVGDPSFSVTSLLLTIIGFSFSFVCRWLGVQLRVFEFIFAAAVIYLLYEIIGHRNDWLLFMPAAVTPGPDHTAVFLSWFVVIRSWTLVSDDAVVFSCVPTLAILGLISGSNPGADIEVYFYLFVVAAIFLLIHQNYLQHRAVATAKERQREDSRVVQTQTAFALFVILAVFVIGTVIIVPVQSLISHAPLIQVFRRLMGAEKVTDSDVSVVPTHFSDDKNFNVGTGDAEWSNSEEVVMHVTPEDNQEHYWRGRTYDVYTGTGWASSQVEDAHPLSKMESLGSGEPSSYHLLQPVTPGEANPPASAPLLKTTFEVKGSTDEFYYPGVPRRLVIAQDMPLRQYDDGCLDRYGVSLSHAVYQVYSAPALDPMLPSVITKLRHAGRNYPAEISRLYIGHFSSDQNNVTNVDDLNYFRQAVKEALQSLPPSSRHTPFDEASAIQDWVSSHCVYSLSVAPISQNVDHVHAFLETTRRGYCDLFASSMAVLCRTARIPARVATGFAPGIRDVAGFSLRAMDKHAWVEVYFPGSGWVTFDPTIGTHTDDSVKPQSVTKPQAAATWTQTFAANETVPRVLIGAILLIVACIIKLEVYDRWREKQQQANNRLAELDPAHARTEIGRRYAQAARTLASLGLSRRASETPAEYEARAMPFLADLEENFHHPLERSFLTRLTALFVAARYSNAETVPITDWEALVQAQTRFEKAAAQVRRAQIWHYVQQLLSGRALNKNTDLKKAER